MYKDTYVEFIQYFWIDTDWGLLWVIVLVTLAFFKLTKLNQYLLTSTVILGGFDNEPPILLQSSHFRLRNQRATCPKGAVAYVLHTGRIVKLEIQLF